MKELVSAWVVFIFIWNLLALLYNMAIAFMRKGKLTKHLSEELNQKKNALRDLDEGDSVAKIINAFFLLIFSGIGWAVVLDGMK